MVKDVMCDGRLQTILKLVLAVGVFYFFIQFLRIAWLF